MIEHIAASTASTDNVDGFDLLIVGGTLIDGSADAEPVAADVGVIGGRIAAIGDLRTAAAGERIDATGRVVCPGFIDPHTHLETALLADAPDATGAVLQGVTTCLSGPDGFGWAPLAEAEARELWRATAGIHDPWPEAMRTASIEAYLGAFNGRIPVNVLPQAPLGAIRFAVAGWDPGRVTGSRLDRMRGILRDWLAAGATGLSAGLDYEPGARCGSEELTDLAREVARVGGTLAAHLRYEDAGRAAAWRELASIGRATGVGVVIAHETLDAEGLACLAAPAGTGGLAIETYLYSASSTHLGINVAEADRIGGPEALRARLESCLERPRIERRLGQVLGAAIDAGERIVFAHSNDPARIGADLAAEAVGAGQGLGPFAARILLDDPQALFIYRHPETELTRGTFIRTITDPSTIIASDGIYRPGRIHPRAFGTFPRILRLAVREWGVLSLSQAIHAMTGRTAARYRVPDRGVIRPAAVADLVILDPERVTDVASWSEPRTAPRGIDQVLVAGVAVVRDGRPTAARPGRVLRAAA